MTGRIDGTMAADTLLAVRDLQVTFNLPEGQLEAVRGVSFSIPHGGTVALVGESGSGKSVVSQAIMGILPKVASVTGGTILFRDPASGTKPLSLATLDPSGKTMRGIRGGRISVIFQEPMTSLSPVHTIGDQVGEALRLHRKVSDSEAHELTRDILRQVDFPDPERALRTYPFELSGGLRQRAMIAMALICRPALLIADEPTTALDVTIQAQILKLIKDLQASLGMAVLVITHDLGVVANIAEDVVVMYRGMVMERGSLSDIFERPQHPYLKALLHAVPRFDMKPGERLQPLREIETHPTAFARTHPRSAQGPAGQTLLEVQNLTKRFAIRKSGLIAGHQRSILAVDDVSFSIRRGECVGLVGESGCGKTTVSKIIMRALTPDEGRVTFDPDGKAVDVLALKGEELGEFRRRIQYIFQDPFGSLNPRMTVQEILSEPLVIHGIGDRQSRQKTVEALMSLVGLDRHHLKRYPHSFSGGQRQRIGIARALALQPDLVICDEPVSALDVSIQAQILNLLKDLMSELGLTYLFISHNLAVVDYIADRIAVMCRGQLVEVAPRKTLFHDPLHPYTKALLTAVPKPDPTQPLDFSALAAERASDPAAWPMPFRLQPGHRASMIEVAPDHFVRADREEFEAAPMRVGAAGR